MIAAAKDARTRPAATPGPARPASRRKELRDRCMKELSRLDRLIIVLYYYEQLTTREVAAVLDLSEDQIETRRQTLARRLVSLAAAGPQTPEAGRCNPPPPAPTHK